MYKYIPILRAFHHLLFLNILWYEQIFHFKYLDLVGLVISAGFCLWSLKLPIESSGTIINFKLFEFKYVFIRQTEYDLWKFSHILQI